MGSRQWLGVTPNVWLHSILEVDPQNFQLFRKRVPAFRRLGRSFGGGLDGLGAFIFHQRVKTTGFQPVSFSCENEEAGGVRWTTDTAVTRYFRSSITLCG